MDLQGTTNQNLIEQIYPRRGTFSTDQQRGRIKNNDKVAVVAVIGKSIHGLASILNSMTGVSLFSSVDFGSSHQVEERNGVSIHFFYDNSKNIIYLHLVSSLNHRILDKKIQTILQSKNSDENLQEWMETSEFESLKAILYLFLISHYVLFLNPGSTVQLQDLKLLRILQRSKSILSPGIHQYFDEMDEKLSFYLTEKSASDTRFYPGYCIPYLFFLFHAPTILSSGESSVGSKGIEETLKINLEQQLKFLLRINRLDRGTLSGTLSREKERDSILFTLDPKGLVYVISQHSQKKNTTTGIVSSMLEQQLPLSLLDEMNCSHFLYSQNGSAHVLGGSYREGDTKTSGAGSISSFAYRLTQQSLKSRISSLPSYSLWYGWTQTLGDYFLSQTEEEIEDQRIAKMKEIIHPSSKFASYRLEVTLFRAREIYFSNIPALYTKVEHESRLCAALQFFYSYVRGTSVETHKQQLVKDCLDFWKDGRQRCDVKSLTGHFCKYPVHTLPSTEDRVINQDAMVHCSDFVATGACNCGKTRRLRKDPFDLKEANCSFFEARCCEMLRSIPLPTYGNSFHSWSLLILGGATTYEPRSGLSQDGFKMRYKFLVPYELTDPRASSSQPKKSSEDFPPLKNRPSHVKGRGNYKIDTRRDPSQQSFSRRNLPGGWIGYEYECSMGHRFIEPIQSIIAFSNRSTSKNEILPIEMAFKTEMPLYINCRSGVKHTNEISPLALLQRVYITTPMNITLKINPVVQIVGMIDGSGRKLTFSLGSMTSIPANCFVCLRLPYVYAYENKPLETQTAVSSPYQCNFRLVT